MSVFSAQRLSNVVNRLSSLQVNRRSGRQSLRRVKNPNSAVGRPGTWAGLPYSRMEHDLLMPGTHRNETFSQATENVRILRWDTCKISYRACKPTQRYLITEYSAKRRGTNHKAMFQQYVPTSDFKNWSYASRLRKEHDFQGHRHIQCINDLTSFSSA